MATKKASKTKPNALPPAPTDEVYYESKDGTERYTQADADVIPEWLLKHIGESALAERLVIPAELESQWLQTAREQLKDTMEQCGVDVSDDDLKSIEYADMWRIHDSINEMVKSRDNRHLPWVRQYIEALSQLGLSPVTLGRLAKARDDEEACEVFRQVMMVIEAKQPGMASEKIKTLSNIAKQSDDFDFWRLKIFLPELLLQRHIHLTDADATNLVKANIELHMPLEELVEILEREAPRADDLEDALESFQHFRRGSVSQQQLAVEKLKLLFERQVDPTHYDLQGVLIDGSDQPEHPLVQLIAREMVKTNPDVHTLVAERFTTFFHMGDKYDDVVAILERARTAMDKEALDASIPTTNKRGGRKPIRL